MECPRFDEERRYLKNTTYDALKTNIKSIFEDKNVIETTRFISKIFNKRFPKKTSKEVSVEKKDGKVQEEKKKKKKKKTKKKKKQRKGVSDERGD